MPKNFGVIPIIPNISEYTPIPINWIPQIPSIVDMEMPNERIEILFMPYSDHVLFQRSNYKSLPATVFFPYPACCKKVRPAARVYAKTQTELGGDSYGFFISESTHVFECVCSPLKYAGFKFSKTSWNILWTGATNSVVLSPSTAYQNANHFPGIFQTGRKDNLCRNINRLKRIHGKEYGICPSTYVLPEDLQKFLNDRDTKEVWIMKPSASSCGRGIYLLGPNSILGATE